MNCKCGRPLLPTEKELCPDCIYKQNTKKQSIIQLIGASIMFISIIVFLVNLL
jgi:NMD protein affecting ribosome stability and mRNA decay